MLWPDEVSLSILRLCEGQRSIAAIAEVLAAEYEADAQDIEADVLAFAQDWSDRMVLGQPMTALGPPIGILAELTHRCPLQCPYCSNPLELLKGNRELDTASWLSIFDQAADLGILQVHLSGGEPTLRQDLPDLVARLASRGVYTNLITAGVGVKEGLFERLAAGGLDHVQLSFQGARPETTDLIGNSRGAHEKKLATAAQISAAGLPLTINAPIHRKNIGEVELFIELALRLGAERLEVANVQYYGWALLNRQALMPERDDVLRMAARVEAAQERLRGVLAIDFVAPDYYALYPKACMGGWARDAFMLTPDGTAMPCHAAASIPHLSFPNAAHERRWPRSGRIRRPSTPFAASTGCASRAAVASARRSTSAAAAARR